MTSKQEKVQRAMAGARPVEDAPFDPSAVPGDTPKKRSSRSGGRSTPPPGAPGGSGEDDSGDKLLKICAAEPETDIGNGRRLLHRHRDKLLNVANRGVHVFDDRRWSWDETDSLARKHCHDTAESIGDERFVMSLLEHETAAIDAAEKTKPELDTLREVKPGDRTAEQKARLYQLEAIAAEGQEARKSFSGRKQGRARHAKSSASSAKIDNMLREAAPYITRTIDEMDEEALAVNCLNGTLRFFETKVGDKSIWDVRLDPHDREDLITKCCAAEWHADAVSARFEAFIEQMQPDPATRAFVQRYLGYCLTGLTHEQVFAFFHGGGRNGKSTLVDIVCRVFDDYAATVPIETLAGEQRRKGGDATPDLMKVPGARLVRASEPESSMKLREAMVKSLTSDEPILIRGLHKDFMEIYPSFKLVISGNHKPRIDNDDNGIWRRVLLVPWGVQLGRADVDKQLGRKLWLERDGILAWLVRGTLLYLEQGLDVPDTVLAATEEYRTESNPIGACLDALFEFGGADDRLDPGEIFNVYDRARQSQGWPQFSPATFNKRLPEQAEARGASKIKSMGLSLYVGIKLTSAAEELMRTPPPSSSHTPSSSAYGHT
jgi:putative DNA primase/helicase